VDQDRIVFIGLPFLVALSTIGGFLLVWGRRRPDDRPWWGNPSLWLAVGVVFVILGVVVWPGLLGGTFIVLPLVWIWRPRRPPPVDPRTNGHSQRR
jgi:hypothetical protein